MSRLALLAVLVLASCGQETRTAFPSPAYIPAVANGLPPVFDPDKGVALFAATCDVLDMLGVGWYYSGPYCEGHERVPYLDTAGLLEAAPGQRPPDAKHVLFLNECDQCRWGCPQLEEQVRLFIAAEKAWLGIIWVGPCAAHDPEYVWKFWAEYLRQTGKPPDPATHRLCLHCYNTARNCLASVERHLGLGVLDRLWLTELGVPLGLDLTLRQAMAENEALVNAVDADPRVERYAFWAAGIEYGWTAPSRPVSGWNALSFWWRDRDGRLEERLTDLGLAYARLPSP